MRVQASGNGGVVCVSAPDVLNHILQFLEKTSQAGWDNEKRFLC